MTFFLITSLQESMGIIEKQRLQNDQAKLWPLKIIRAIPVGFSQWKSLYHKICVFILTKICKNTDHPLVKKEIDHIINLHRKEETDEKVWKKARTAYAAEIQNGDESD